MNKNEVISFFKENLTAFFDKMEFSYFSINDGFFFERVFLKNIHDRINYGLSFYGDKHNLNFISACRQFTEVEQILLTGHNKHELGEYELKNMFTIQKWSDKIYGGRGKHFRIYDYNSINEAVANIKAFIVEEGIPFLKQFDDLESVNAYIKHIEKKELVSLLGGYNAWLRRIIIAHKCGDQEAVRNYLIEAREIYSSNKEQNVINEKYWKVFLDIEKAVLEELNP